MICSDPMRITKKYSGSSAVGKQTFVPCEPTEANLLAKASCEQDLDDLQQRFQLALSTPTTDISGDNYTLIADGSGCWMSVDEHTFHFPKKSKIHKSASAPALNRLADGLNENNRYIDRSSITSMASESRTRANSLKAYAMDDTAAGNTFIVYFIIQMLVLECVSFKIGNLLLDFFESVRSDLEGTKVSPSCTRPMSTIMEDGGDRTDELAGFLSNPLVVSVSTAAQISVSKTEEDVEPRSDRSSEESKVITTNNIKHDNDSDIVERRGAT